MTAQELFEILKKTGYPTRYSHFSKAQKPPFIAFLSNFSNNFFADNKTFKNINHWQIELYTETKDVEAETKVEEILSDGGAELVSGGDRYKVKFKAVEIYESVKSAVCRLFGAK